MKKSALAAAALVTGLCGLLTSCEEKAPYVEFGKGVVAKDSTYLAATETPELRRVLLEEFTGVTCPNCPQGHQNIAALEGQFPGRVIAIGYYVFGQGQTKPVEHLTKQDFRTQDATDIANTVFTGVPYLPAGVADRTKRSNGQYMAGRADWLVSVPERIAKVTPVNLKVESSFTESSREAVIKVRAAFTQDYSKSVKLHIALLEDNIIDAQENSQSVNPSHIDTFYVHKHVLRDVVTQVAGDAILSDIASKEAGRVYERTLVYKLEQNWDPAHCKVVAYLTSGESEDKEVLQAAETDVK